MTTKAPDETMSDEEWEDAAPLRGETNAEVDEPLSGEVLDPEGKEPGDDEDEEDEGSKSASLFSDLEPPEDIEALSLTAELLNVKGGAKTSTAQFELPWTSALQVHTAYKKALQIRFGGVDAFGVTVKSTSSNTDADGAVRFKVTFELPEGQRKQAAELFMLSGKNGPLEIEPTQLSLNLTARAE